MNTKKILGLIGVALLIMAIVKIFRQINDATSTKLYSDDGLRELQDDKSFKDVEVLRKKSSQGFSI